MKKSFLTMIIPLVSLCLSSLPFQVTDLNFNKDITLKRAQQNFVIAADKLQARFLKALDSFLIKTRSESVWNPDDFYSRFTDYTQGGEYITKVDDKGNPPMTIYRDIELRYYDGIGQEFFLLVNNYDYYSEKPLDSDHPKGSWIIDPSVPLSSSSNVSVRPSWATYYKNGNDYSPCVTSASLNFLKSMSVTHRLQRPTDGSAVNTAPYILNDKLGSPPKSAGDPFNIAFSEETCNRIGFSGQTYNGVALLMEDRTNPLDYGYMYNEYVKLSSVIGWGGDSIIPGLNSYLKEHSLSGNKKHRLAVSGTRKLISSKQSYYELVDYLNNSKSGLIGGDDDYVFPDNSGTIPGGHAFNIVGYGITKKRDTANTTAEIPEIIYDTGDGKLAAMPAFDLCDWFDLTLTKQNKEWFGWRSSTADIYRG